MKNKKQLILGIMIGIIITLPLTIHGANKLYDAIEVAYNNKSSGTAKTEVQGAIDELYELSKTHCPDGYACQKVEKGTYFVYDYTGKSQSFTVPKSGTYQLEVWGAQGGSYGTIGGYGGYSTGNIYLEKGQVLYLYIGGTTDTTLGGYNGGGMGTGTYDARGGGGATHIALKEGLLSTLSSNNDKQKILIVAGGGGGSDHYNNGSDGGSAGGYIGNSGGYYRFPDSLAYTVSTGGSQTQGGTGAIGAVNGESGVFGAGGNAVNSEGGGGGGGYYGGGSGSWNISVVGSGAGGSSYIANPLLSNKEMYCYNCSTSSEENTKTITTTSVSEMPVSKYAKSGNGYAKITYISENDRDFSYIGNVQVHEITQTGTYQLEVWGASGSSSGGIGGYGGYSRGEVYLNKGENLYVVVGGTGTEMIGGYNGGGNGSKTYITDSLYKNGGGGGGATHIALKSGILSELSSEEDRKKILIVSGGGGGGAYITENYNGGSGGGISGVNGTGRSVNPIGGTQTSGYLFGKGQNGIAGTDSVWGESGRGGGGGGLYGGSASQTATDGIAGGGGGSGYIGNSLLSNKVMYCYNCTTSTATNTKTYTTTNVSKTPISNYAKSGNGYAKITFIK